MSFEIACWRLRGEMSINVAQSVYLPSCIMYDFECVCHSILGFWTFSKFCLKMKNRAH